MSLQRPAKLETIICVLLYGTLLNSLWYNYPYHDALGVSEPRLRLWLQAAFWGGTALLLRILHDSMEILQGPEITRKQRRSFLIGFGLFTLTLYPFHFDPNAKLSFYQLINAILMIGLFFHLSHLALFRYLFLGVGKCCGALWKRIPDPLWMLVITLGFLTCTLFLSHNLFGNIPHIQDSIAQLASAKILLYEHRFSMPVHPFREFFPLPFGVIDGVYQDHTSARSGHYGTQYPPGHSILLALGVLAGAPHWVNPLLGVAALGFTYGLGKELYGRSVGRLAALLLALSPFVIIMSSEYMNHATALCATMAALWGYVRATRSGKHWPALIAGLGLGWLLMTRPLNAFCLGIVLLCWYHRESRRNRTRYRQLRMTAMIPLLLCILVQMVANHHVNGSVLHYTYTTVSSHHWPGFFLLHNTQPLLNQLADFARATNNNLVHFNQALMPWGLPGMLLMCLAWTLRSTQPATSWLWMVCLAQIAGYFSYYFQDLCFGPRFLYELSGIACILTCAWCHALWQQVQTQHGTRAAQSLVGGMLVLFLTATALSYPLRLPWTMVHYRSNYWQVANDYYAKLSASMATKEGKFLVFVHSDYRNVASSFPPRNSDKVIYAADLGPHNRILAQHYQDRTPLFADGNANLFPWHP